MYIHQMSYQEYCQTEMHRPSLIRMPSFEEIAWFLAKWSMFSVMLLSAANLYISIRGF